MALMALLVTSCDKDEATPVPKPLTFDRNMFGQKGWSVIDTVLWGRKNFIFMTIIQIATGIFLVYRNNKGQEYQFEDTYFTNTYCSGNTTVLRWEPVCNHVNFYFRTPFVDKFEVISLTENLFLLSQLTGILTMMAKMNDW